MTDTKLEPELPNLPPYDYFVELANGDEYGCWMGQTLRAYALSAIEADRNKRAPAVSLTDEQICRIAETLPKPETGIPEDYPSWGCGYRQDAEGNYTIPILPESVIPFARALLSSVAPRVPEWMPIETAPKDTTEMFVVCAFGVNFHRIRNYTSDAYAVWANKGKFERWPHMSFGPTHWTSLPSAPAPTVQPTTAELPAT